MLVSELDDYGKYKERQVLSEFWLEHIMGILRTAPVRLMELTDGGLEQFYQKIDFVCLNDFSDDIVKKSEKLWSKALEISSGVKNVGPNLSCDFLKESGFTDFVKMDIHMIRSMSEFCNLNNCKSLSDFELFTISQWLAKEIQITPFRLDKIL